MTPTSIMHVSANQRDSCGKSGLVHTIAYIKLPTALVYGTRVMYSHSSTVVGDMVIFNLKWGANGVLTDFVSPTMLNLWSTFCKYPFCVKLTFHFFSLAQSLCLAPSTLHQDPPSRTLKTSLSLFINCGSALRNNEHIITYIVDRCILLGSLL